jgi:hypothetical protein
MSPTTLSKIKRKLRKGDLRIVEKYMDLWHLYDHKIDDVIFIYYDECPTPTLEAAASRITNRQWAYFWLIELALQVRANTNKTTNTGQLMRALKINPKSQRVFTDHLLRLQEEGYLNSVEKKGNAGNVISHDWKLTGKKPFRF